MKIYKNIHSTNDFEFWCGAISTVNMLTEGELEIVFNTLEKINSEGMSEIEFNNFFWLETDLIAKWLGWDDFKTLWNARHGENWFNTQDEYKEYLESKENDEDD